MTLLTKHRWLALLVTLLLAINPIHIFYSQEIRMYGLGLFLTLAATIFLWRMEQQLAHGDKPYASTVGYIIFASLALLTLYYTGLLLLAHQLWVLARYRQNWRRQSWFLVAAILILLIQLPWWLYALPKLITYVADKVRADQDLSLPLWSYLGRHWLAFFAGHLLSPRPWLEKVRQIVAVLSGIAVIAGALLTKRRTQQWILHALLSFILIPILVGFGVNVLYPFFPDGGERLLIQILPYVLLLLIYIVGSHCAARPLLATLMLGLPIVAATIGTLIFFTTPRYIEDDYRPLIADVIRQSRADDTVLALFPWQVGYWRAYTPRIGDGTLLAPQPNPVDQQILSWDSAFAERLDAELQTGTIWFPMPLSFGSTLPTDIENYLKTHARNLENRWYTDATRLTAWVQIADSPQQLPIDATYADQLHLVSAGAAPVTVTSANTPLAVDLCWQPSVERDDLSATLRLQDDSGYTWAKRDLSPLATYVGINPDIPCLETVAINIPIGLPPDTYQLVVGVGPKNSDQLFTATTASSPLMPIEQITLNAPNETLSPHRLPIEHHLSTPAADSGLLLLGYTGPDASEALLAGDEVDLTLFLQNTNAQPPAREVFVSLLDTQSNGVAGWQDGPLANYPTNTWSQGALVQAPIHFFLPPNLTAGDFTLIAGFVDPATGNKSTPVLLNPVQILRRPATFIPPTAQTPVLPQPTFGSHAILIGYHVSQNGVSQVGPILKLELIWQILQPLLPPHAIFVHLFDATGQRIAQTDGAPATATGRAPTGSWLPDEFLTTQHILTLPADAQQPFTIQTGLYLPSTGVRLPVTVDGTTVGDSITITVLNAP